MSAKVTLKIVPFQNPSGHVVHRVSGSIYGKRVQKNFATVEVARTFMHGLLKAADQGESMSARVTTTSFARDEYLREAELAWARLREAHPKGSLVTAVDYYLANAGQVIRDGDALVVLDEFIERRRERGNKDKTLTVCRAILRSFLVTARIRRISEITRERTQAWVYDDSVAIRTRRDRHDQLNNFGEFLVKLRYLAKNPAEELDRPKVTYDGKVTTLHPDQILGLLRRAAISPVGRKRTPGVMLAYFAVTSLSGVRPDEARRLGEDWKWFSKENGIITGFRAKTSNKPRTVEIDPHLIEILEHCRSRGWAPADFSTKAFNQIRTAIGVFDLWDNDILRHTYASHHYAWKRDMGWLQKNMGNSEDVLKRSYIDHTILAEQGRRLFEITLADILPSASGEAVSGL
jgi:integrase